MTKSDRVKPVIKVAQNREREAARVFAEAQRLVQERERKLAELRAYREEYRAGFHRSGGAGVSALSLRGFHAFLRRLDQAVEQQEQLVAAAQRELDQRKQLWLEKHFRAKALDHVRDRYRAQEQREIARIEQKDADERAQRTRPHDEPEPPAED
jgi:flagellar FliJ protein